MSRLVSLNLVKLDVVNKIAYHSGETSQVKGPSADLVDKESATETGGRGFNLVEMTSEFDKTDPDIYDENADPEHLSHNQIVPKELFDQLILLGDEMDNNGEESLAEFADFLIKKFAETENTVSPTILFNQLMIKIANADLVNTNELIKKLCKIYSRTMLLEYINNKDLEKSKESAYKKVLHRADQYLSEG